MIAKRGVEYASAQLDGKAKEMNPVHGRLHCDEKLNLGEYFVD
jgi:hypothetical protein